MTEVGKAFKGAAPPPSARAEIEQRIVSAAQGDAAFRARLLASPRDAVAELLGVQLPARLDVRVVEELPDRLYIVLPVDLSGMGRDAQSAMLGRSLPAPPAAPPAAPAPAPGPTCAQAQAGS